MIQTSIAFVLKVSYEVRSQRRFLFLLIKALVPSCNLCSAQHIAKSGLNEFCEICVSGVQFDHQMSLLCRRRGEFGNGFDLILHPKGIGWAQEIIYLIARKQTVQQHQLEWTSITDGHLKTSTSSSFSCTTRQKNKVLVLFVFVDRNLLWESWFTKCCSEGSRSSCLSSDLCFGGWVRGLHFKRIREQQNLAPQAFVNYDACHLTERQAPATAQWSRMMIKNKHRVAAANHLGSSPTALRADFLQDTKDSLVANDHVLMCNVASPCIFFFSKLNRSCKSGPGKSQIFPPVTGQSWSTQDLHNTKGAIDQKDTFGWSVATLRKPNTSECAWSFEWKVNISPSSFNLFKTSQEKICQEKFSDPFLFLGNQKLTKITQFQGNINTAVSVQRVACDLSHFKSQKEKEKFHKNFFWKNWPKNGINQPNSQDNKKGLCFLLFCRLPVSVIADWCIFYVP